MSYNCLLFLRNFQNNGFEILKLTPIIYNFQILFEIWAIFINVKFNIFWVLNGVIFSFKVSYIDKVTLFYLNLKILKIGSCNLTSIILVNIFKCQDVQL